MSYRDRFLDKVARPDGDGCWEWVGAVNKHGYGLFSVGGRSRLAHRISYELAHGEIPSGLNVLHSCDNPPCVNPSHLFIGNQADNVKDMLAKGRQPAVEVRRQAARTGARRGQRHWASVVTESDVRAMRAAHADGASQKDIAEIFGVTASNVSRIVRRDTWAHV